MIDWLSDRIFGVSVPSDDVIRWQLDVFAWLLERSGGQRAFQRRTIVVPTEACFPLAGIPDSELGEKIFLLTRKHAGLDKWPCRAEIVQEDPDPSEGMSLFLRGHSRDGAAGTFSVSGQEVVIRYSSDKLSNPHHLIATFAHELAHYFLAAQSGPPPGGEEAYEPATDVTAVFLGFGIFLANSAFSFEERRGIGTHGYSAERQGYLNEVSLAYALAIFTELSARQPEVSPHLKTNPRAYHRQAVNDLRKRWSLRLGQLAR